MRPLGDPGVGILAFGPSAARRGLPALVCASGVLLVAVILLNPSLQSRIRGLALPGAAVLILAGAVCAVRQEYVTIDLDARTVGQRRGLGRVAREHRSSVDEYSRLLLLQTPRGNLLGDVEWRTTLELEGQGRRVMLFRNLDAPAGAELARAISRRIYLPVETDGAPQGSRFGSLSTTVLWVFVVGILGSILWPTANGKQRAPLQWEPAWGTAPSHFGNARYFYSIGNFEASERELRQALDRHPDSAEIYNLLAYALVEQHKLDDALAAGIQALKLAPNDGDILDTVGEMHQRRQEWSLAADYYQRALTREPRFSQTETRVKYGQTLLKLGRREEAVWQLERAEGDGQSPWANRAKDTLATLRAQGKRK